MLKATFSSDNLLNRYQTKLADFFWTYITGCGLILYLLFLFIEHALAWYHLVIASLVGLLNYHKSLKKYFKLWFPYALYAVIYDSLHFLTPKLHRLVPIHVRELYDLELKIFGLQNTLDGITTKVIPCVFLASHTHLVLDLLTGLVYGTYLLELFGFSFLLTLKPQYHALLKRLAYAFLVLNLLAFITYYLYPVAPPWYVLEHGFGPVEQTIKGSAGRLSVIDNLFHMHYFQDYYALNANVFAAFPSLHAAYPTLVWLYGQKYYRGHLGSHLALGGFSLLMYFAGVYLGHHYIIDIIFGIIYALVVYGLFEKVLLASRSTR